MILKFFAPTNAPHPLGDNLARNWCRGGFYAKHGEPLADVNLHYGILHGGTEMHLLAKAQNKHFVHVDHAFFGRTEDLASEDGYFRFALNGQANEIRKTAAFDADRLALLQARGLLKLEAKRPIKKNKMIVYQPPSAHMVAYYRLPDDFDGEWRATLRRMYPGMMVLTTQKSPKTEDFWENVAVVASFNSALGFEALRRGCEAVMTAPKTLWPYTPNDVNDGKWAERRYEMFCEIAGRMWNFREMRRGDALRHMNGNGEIPS
jgi:hypothetical protein